MAKGLQFNPYGNLGFPNTGNTQSVPTTADEYSKFNLPANQWGGIDWSRFKPAKDSPLMQAWNSYQQWSSLDDEGKERLAIISDPMYEINQWDLGLSGLDRNERMAWEQQNSSKIADKSDAWKERLWKNQQFAKTFGMDAFYGMPDAEERDRLYYDFLTTNAIDKKFKDNANIEQLRSLTPEGKIELLNSDYQSDWEIMGANSMDKDRKWGDYSLKERWNAVNKDAVDYGMTGIGTGSIAGAAFEGVGSIPGAVIGGLMGMGAGVFKGVFSPEDAMSVNQADRRRDNEEILNKIQTADNERKKQDSQSEISTYYGNLVQEYQNGSLSSDDINQMFDSLALSDKKTGTDELGLSKENDYSGSNYYTMFKDTDEFAHFGIFDKLKYIAQTQILKRKYGQDSAIQVLDQDMQNYVSDNQTGWEWAGSSLKNILVGGIANLAMSAAGLGALGARLLYGEEGLNNYLQGKDASGDGSDNWLNPQYWEKVDQYNTFDKDAIEKAEKNGGISIYNNVVTPGTEGDFWSWNTMNEAIRMNKFTWSQLLQNFLLGKLVGGATKLTGGIEMAPGVLAQESTALSKAVNKIGAWGVIGSSSLGIDAAYGMQTYNETLRQNNQRIDKIIDADTDRIVKERLQTPQAQEEFRQYIDAENARRKSRAGERNSYIGVDEKQAWQDYVAHVTRQVREEQEELHKEDRQQAELSAANAYAIDATVEGLRMATTNAAFKSYLFDKGTLNAIRNNNPYVNVTTKNGQYALASHAVRDKAAKVIGTQVWGGFHSNYFDDVTVGFAEGFGIQDYNNYLLQKYNPASYGAVLDDYVDPIVAGMAGAVNAMTEKRSFIDGGVGAIGSLFSFSPNVGGILSHREMMKQAAEAAEKGGNKNGGISGVEYASHFFSNPILQAFADAKAASRMTEAEIKRVNDILKENGYAFENMAETLSGLNMKALAREGTSVIEAEDAKDREAFNLAQNLLSMKHSSMVQNAQAEPDKARWGWKKKAGYTIHQILNGMLGLPMFEVANSSYQTAMQQLQDASMLDRNVRDNAQAERQQKMINTFLNLDADKNAVQGMSAEESESFAKERLKKNADNLLEMIDRSEKIQQNFEKSLTAQMHPHIAQQLMYQYVLDGRWKKRLSELEQQIVGEVISATPYNPDKMLIAKYGSMAGYERTRKAQQKRVDEAQEAYDKADMETKKEADPAKSIAENSRIKAMRQLRKRSAKANLQKEQSSLKGIEAEEETLKEVLGDENPVLSADQILRLDADDRLRILDDFYRSDYSAEQQKQIDAAKALLMQDGTPINETMEKIRDASILTHRIEDNMEAARKIMQNPATAEEMQQALEENRKKAVIDYFNDKIVAEAFLDFQRDSESTLSEEKTAEKAQGYSTAVLNGMLRTIEKEYKRKRSGNEVSDKTLSIIEEGVKKVLNQRDNKLKETAELDKFIRKTQKIKHTETVEKPLINGNTGEVEGSTGISEQITTDRELSQNDRMLLDNALDFAAERGLSVEDLPNAVATQEFDDYVREKNHAYDLTVNPLTGDVVETNVGTAENRANIVSHDYMSGLVSDILKAYNANKEKVQAAKNAKPIAGKPESVATAPVEAKQDKSERKDEGERRADDVKVDVSSNNIFAGLTSRKTGTADGNSEQVERQESEKSRNAQIIEDADMLSPGILQDLEILLERLDKMDMPEQTREKLKDIILSNLSSSTFNSIESLQNRILEDSIVTSEAEAPQIAMKGTALANIDIAEIKRRKSSGQSAVPPQTADDSNNTEPLPAAPLILETRDLDAIMPYPVWKNYLNSHNVVGFLQKLADIWNQEREAWQKDGKQGLVHQSQVVFIYDPALASQVEESFRASNSDESYSPETDAPILMAIEITDKNRYLIDNEEQLLIIEDKAADKIQGEGGQKEFVKRKYQVIGVMPSSTERETDSEQAKANARRMSAIRQRINFNDSEPHTLRYSAERNPSKYNGTIIKTNIVKLESHTDEESIPHSTEDTPRNNVQKLMDSNLASETESLVKASAEEKEKYESAKEKGFYALINDGLYQRLRSAFISRLFKRERRGKAGEESETAKKNYEIDFRLQKGTADTFPKIVLTRKISDTLDRVSGRPIVSMLREVGTDEVTPQEIINSNSRFRRLFSELRKIEMPKGLFDKEGRIVNKADFNKKIAELEKSIGEALDNNLEVYERHIRVEIENTPTDDKNVNINVYSGDVNNNNNLLTTLTLKYTGQIEESEFASFLKNLILDKEGNTRPNPEFRKYERVKWQVNYADIETANGRKKDGTKYTTEELKNKSVKKSMHNASRNIEDLYDDGVFEMQVTKLAYPSRSVTVNINPTMEAGLYPERKETPKVPPVTVTEQHAAHEVEGPTGTVDSNTGMPTGAPVRKDVPRGIPRTVMETINRIIEDSKTRELTDDGNHYNILGQLWSRVTSIKYALDRMGERFNPSSPWAVPSSLLGNSADEFGRDVFNGVFDKMTDAERKAAFEGYSNATGKNYEEVFHSLKAFEARLAGIGQVIIATGDRENPGHITVRGTLDVTVKGQSGLLTKKVRVAGTLDVLTVDSNGYLHIYDFKTTHDRILSKEEAISANKGFDRQLSMYARFLEEEYGLKVASINIIPIKAEYPNPRSQDDYIQARPGSNQLLRKNSRGEYETFNTKYTVGKEFSLDRLDDSSLIASFDRMTEEEKKAIVEAIQDQSETPAAEAEIKTGDIADVKPEIPRPLEDEEEEEGGRLRRRGRLSRKNISQEMPSPEETAQAISPDDSRGLLNRLEEFKKNCGVSK